MNDERAEQIVHALIGIGAELTTIRQELQQQNNRPPEPAETEGYTCRSCGREFGFERLARHHAVNDHNAPGDCWQEVFE